MLQPICIAILSDIHIKIPYAKAKRVNDLHKALITIGQHREVDAICVLGDLSDHGLSIQVRKVCIEIQHFEERTFIPCFVNLGNHDLRHFLPFLSSPKTLMKQTRHYLHHEQCEEVYECNLLNHMPILMLESERSLKDNAFISEQQIHWLNDQLVQSASQSYKIVMNHQPLSNTHPRSDKFGIGQQDKVVKEVLQKHSHVIWLSGHIHNDARKVSAKSNEWGIQIDVPSFQLPINKDAPIGCGCLLYLYEHNIQVDVMDFINDCIVQSYQIDNLS